MCLQAGSALRHPSCSMWSTCHSSWSAAMLSGAEVAGQMVNKHAVNEALFQKEHM